MLNTVPTHNKTVRLLTAPVFASNGILYSFGNIFKSLGTSCESSTFSCYKLNSTNLFSFLLCLFPKSYHVNARIFGLV